jgi:hypothetical protein
MIITNRAIPRRTILRGVGATLALPFLEAMVPAFPARAAMTAPLRFGTAYVPAGLALKNFWPATERSDFEITRILEPFRQFRDQMIVVGGLNNSEADPKGSDGSGGDHSRTSGAFLTAAHPKRTEGPDMHVGISFDQVLAKHFAKQTQLASLELTLGNNAWIGACDPGYACPYSRTLAWSSPTTPLPTENDPRVIFERLFGDVASTDTAARVARMKENRSLLDSVTSELTRVERRLGSGDRQKLDQYLEAVRDIERRIQVQEQQKAREILAVDQPGAVPERYDDHAKLIFDLQVLAFQTDLTRVFTIMMGYEGSDRPYPEIGVPDGHHSLTHNLDAVPYEKQTQINEFHARMFAYFVEKLRSVKEGEGTLLDNTVLIYGSGISNGNSHNHSSIPIVLMGGLGGKLKGGRYIRYNDVPFSNLLLTLGDKIGLPPMDRFGDSTGRVTDL